MVFGCARPSRSAQSRAGHGPLAAPALPEWTGTTRQWKTLRAANLTLGAFYLMGYAFVHMLLTTDLGQSLLPGWRSAYFPYTAP